MTEITQIMPMRGYAIVSRKEKTKTTESGIILKSGVEEIDYAVVENNHLTSDVNRGDLLLVDWRQAKKLGIYEDKQLYSIDEQYIVGVFEE